MLWTAGAITYAYYGFDGQTYGLQSGYSPGIDGCNMGFIKYLFNSYPRSGNSFEIKNIHAEEICSLGFFGTPTESAQSFQPIPFLGCNFNLSNSPASLGLFTDHHLVTSTSIIFIACNFINPQASSTLYTPFRVLKIPQCSVIFDTCDLLPNQLLIGQELALGLSVNQASTQYNYDNFVFRNCNMADGVRGNLNGVSYFSNENIKSFGTGDYSFNRSYIPIGANVKFTAQGNPTDYIFNGSYPNLVSLGSLSLTILSTGIGSITVPNGNLVNVGDLIINTSSFNYENWDGNLTLSDQFCAIGQVTNVAGNVITITGLPQNLTAGTYNFYSTWFSRYHTATTGTTSTSISITALSAVYNFVVGNHILGSGILPGTYVTAVDNTAATLTLSQATTSSATGVRLYDADMQILTGTAI